MENKCVLECVMFVFCMVFVLLGLIFDYSVFFWLAWFCGFCIMMINLQSKNKKRTGLNKK